MAKTNSNNQNLSAVIRAEVSASLKAAYEEWWRKTGFASEADAIRWHVRNVTGWNPQGHEESENSSGT